MPSPDSLTWHSCVTGLMLILATLVTSPVVWERGREGREGGKGGKEGGREGREGGREGGRGGREGGREGREGGREGRGGKGGREGREGGEGGGVMVSHACMSKLTAHYIIL